MREVEFECPKCGLPLMKFPGRDSYGCIACRKTWSGTATVMLAYPLAEVPPIDPDTLRQFLDSSNEEEE